MKTNQLIENWKQADMKDVIGASVINKDKERVAVAVTAEAVRAAAKGMKLDDVRVTVTHASASTFQRQVHLDGTLSAAERRLLLDAAKSTDIQGMLSGANIMDVPA